MESYAYFLTFFYGQRHFVRRADSTQSHHAHQYCECIRRTGMDKNYYYLSLIPLVCDHHMGDTRCEYAWMMISLAALFGTAHTFFDSYTRSSPLPSHTSERQSLFVWRGWIIYSSVEILWRKIWYNVKHNMSSVSVTGRIWFSFLSVLPGNA